MPAVKYTILEVYNIFKHHKCELLESIYKNNSTKMKYKCNCGNIDFISLNKFNMGRRCKECRKIKLRNLYKFSQNYVENYFKEHRCQLLDNYINSDTLMNYICECGRNSKISFYKFKNGQRCKMCKYENHSKLISGDKNVNWNPDRNKIRKLQKLHTLSISSKRKFKKKCNITNSSFHVDHIFPIKAFVEHGIYDLDIINSEDNLQMLSATDNLKKNDKYNKNEFIKYLESKGILYALQS